MAKFRRQEVAQPTTPTATIRHPALPGGVFTFAIPPTYEDLIKRFPAYGLPNTWFSHLCGAHDRHYDINVNGSPDSWFWRHICTRLDGSDPFPNAVSR